MRGPICYRCGLPIPGSLSESYGFCSICREGGSAVYDEARSWGLYEAELRRVIQAFKFDGHLRLAEPLSDLLRQCQEEYSSAADCIVPVPLHPKRRRERGFDQTLLLARSLSAKMRVPLLRCVRRRRNTVPQFGLNHRERRRNIKGAFELTSRQEVEGSRILIVDDVMTTGATVEEICRVLKRANPEAIGVLTVARVSKVFY
jgi:ComF family protein